MAKKKETVLRIKFPRAGKIVIWKSDVSECWHWTMLAPNRKKIACSGEGYATRRGCIRAVHNLLKYIMGVEVVEACSDNTHLPLPEFEG